MTPGEGVHQLDRCSLHLGVSTGTRGSPALQPFVQLPQVRPRLPVLPARSLVAIDLAIANDLGTLFHVEQGVTPDLKDQVTWDNSVLGVRRKSAEHAERAVDEQEFWRSPMGTFFAPSPMSTINQRPSCRSGDIRTSYTSRYASRCCCHL